MIDPSLPPSANNARIDEAIANYLMAVDAGQRPDREQFLNKYPDIRFELEQFLDDDIDANFALGGPATPIPSALDMTTEFVAGRDLQKSSIPPSSSKLDSLVESLPRQVGPYRLMSLLGEGGMGRVYEAIDNSGERVAIKILSQNWSRSPESMLRFKQEGALAGTINHPRCVFVRAVDEWDGLPLIVMELMSGKTLRDLVVQSGPLSVSDAVARILDVIEGLEQAHQRGMIHRDIKPANCFLERDGRVKVGDFGLARSMETESDLTQSGSFIGTPLFASPEQIRGEKLDVRTDIYSVCATLYYLLTGKAPFANYSATQVIARIVSEDPSPLRAHNPNLPSLLEKIVQQGLQRAPDKRFQSLEELRSALEPFVRGKLAFAQTARRLAAYGFDTWLITVVFYGASIFMLGRISGFEENTISLFVSLTAAIWMYYAFMEIAFGATLGKLALSLHVVDSKTGERASPVRIVLRVFIYFFVGSLIFDLAYFLLAPEQEKDQWAILLSLGHAIGFLFLCIPLIWTRSGMRLLHDLGSGTMVVARPAVSTRMSLVRHEDHSRFDVKVTNRWPKQLGPYRVSGAILEEQNRSVLAAEDTQLRRTVWILATRGSGTRVSAARRSFARVSRLRWLCSGLQEQVAWDAFVAPTGAPLRFWVAPGKLLNWKESRGILEQLLEEFRAAQADGTSVQLNSLDQIWLDEHGRVVLTDWMVSPRSEDISAANSHFASATDPKGDDLGADTAAQERLWAYEAMRVCLCGQAEKLSTAPNPIQACVPIHARRLLQKIIPLPSNPISLERLQAELRDSFHQPTQVNLSMRFASIGLSCITLLWVVAFMISVSRVGNQVMLMRLADHLIESEALLKTANQSEWMNEWKKSDYPPTLESGSSSLVNSADIEAIAKEQKNRYVDEMARRFQFAGSILVQVLKIGGIHPDMDQQLSEVVWKRVDEKSFALEAENWPKKGDRYRVSAEDLQSQLQKPATHSMLDGLKRKPYFIVVLAQIPLIALILWGGLSRGGIPFLLPGIRVVRSNGSLAPWWLNILRAIVLWGPFLVINVAIVTIDLFYPQVGWMALFLHLSMMFLLLIYALVAVAWPQRSPHDWLLGTYLVPK